MDDNNTIYVRLDKELNKKIQKYKSINRKSYKNIRQTKMIDSILSFFEENAYITNKQIMALINCLNSFFEFVKSYPENKERKFLQTEIECSFIKELKLYKKLFNKNGVYFLYNAFNKIIYIGKSCNLAGRILQSSKDKKAAHKFSFIITKTHIESCILELFYISKYKPIFNYDPAIIDDIKELKIDHNYKMSKTYKISRK